MRILGYMGTMGMLLVVVLYLLLSCLTSFGSTKEEIVDDKYCNDYRDSADYHLLSNQRSRSTHLIGTTANRYTNYETNYKRFDKLFSKLQDPSFSLRVVVIGGSLTAGRMVGGYANAWPQILERMLNLIEDRSFIQCSFNITNRATPGTTLKWALMHLESLVPHDEHVDLVIAGNSY